MVYHGKTLENRCSFLVSFDIASKIDAFYTGGKVQVSLRGKRRAGGGGGGKTYFPTGLDMKTSTPTVPINPM